MPSSILHAAVVARNSSADIINAARSAYGLDQIHGEGLWWL